MAQQLVPRAVALQGGAAQVPSPKRRRVETGAAQGDSAATAAAAALPAALAAAAAATARKHHPGREAARREWGPPQLSHVLPALYMRECSTAAEAAAIARGQPLPKPARAAKRAPPPRPNYFLALQVSHAPSVVSAIQKVQAAVCKHSPHLKKACVEAVSSHLTLGVMALQSADDIIHAEGTLSQLAAVLRQQDLLAPLELSLGGLSHFNGQVLYLDVEEGDGLQQLMAAAGAVRSHFAEAGLLQDAHRDFTPHVTIAKLSKLPRGRSKGAGGGVWREGRKGAKGSKGPRGGERKGSKGGEGRERDWRGTYETLLDADVEATEREGKEEDARAAPVAGEMDMEARGFHLGEGEGSGEETPANAAIAAADCPEVKEAIGAGSDDDDASAMADRKRDCGGRHGKHGGKRSGREGRWDEGGRGGEAASGGIPQEAYASLMDIEGGKVMVAEVQLCRMMGRKPGEYYFVHARSALRAEEAPAPAGEGAAPAAAAAAAATEGS